MKNEFDNKPSATAFYEMRSDWLDYIATLSTISHADFRVGYFIARRMNGDEQSMWWKVGKIAKEIGCSTNTVSDATRKLEDLGLLVVVRPKRGVNRYFLRMPYHLQTH